MPNQDSPAFEIINQSAGRHIRIFKTGQVEHETFDPIIDPFGINPTIIVNRIPQLIKAAFAAGLAQR